jgi:hypothetical protein
MLSFFNTVSQFHQTQQASKISTAHAHGTLRAVAAPIMASPFGPRGLPGPMIMASPSASASQGSNKNVPGGVQSSLSSAAFTSIWFSSGSMGTDAARRRVSDWLEMPEWRNDKIFFKFLQLQPIACNIYQQYCLCWLLHTLWMLVS